MNTSKLALICLIALPGCIGPPKQDHPAPPLPTQYSAERSAAQSFSADAATQALVPGMAPIAQWWRQFQSPELDALVEEGLAHSPSLAAAESTLRAAHEQLRSQIGGNLFPSLDAGFAPSRQRALTIPDLPRPTFLYDVFALEAQASYKFDFFGVALNADRALAQQVEQQRWQFEATRRGLAANIVVATVHAAALDEMLQATTRQAELSEEYARQLAARDRLGGVAHDDALSASLNAAQLTGQIPALRAQVLAVRHAQAVLLGRTPDQAPEPLPLESLRVPTQIPLSVPSELLHQRPDILAAEAAMDAAGYEAGAAAALLYPSLTLTAAYGQAGFDWSDFTGPAGKIWSVGATLSQPLFHGGALRAQKRQYAAMYSAAQSAYRETVLAAFQNVADTLAALEQDNLALEQARRASDAAQSLEADQRSRFGLGAIPWTASLTESEQYQTARSALARARAARLADSAALFEAMGNAPAPEHPDRPPR